MTQRGRRGHHIGEKIAGRHTTALDEVSVIVKTIEVFDDTRINLNVLRHVGGGPRRLKFKSIPAGWKLTVRGATGIQTVFVYTKHPTSVKRVIERAWKETYG